MRRRVALLLVAASIAVLTLAIAGPAQATDTNVYVVVRDRVCGDPSLHVRGIHVNVQPTGWTSAWDYGDNIIYPKVRLYTTNTVRAEVKCYKHNWLLGWIPVGFAPVVNAKFYPTTPKQTIWIG